MTGPMKFRDLSGLTTAVKTALGVYIAVAVIGVWSGWQELELLQRVADGAFLSDAEAVANDSRQAAIGGLFMLVFLVTAVLFLRLTYLSNRNARSLCEDGLEFTPGWAVGWYFVPIAHLLKPYQALREIFKASHPDHTDNWRQAPPPAIMPLWWTLWILVSLVGQVLFRLTLSAETLEAILTASWLTLASDILDIPLGITLIALVSTLQGWQDQKRRRVAALAA
jgi:hypothetical protein